VLSGVQDERAGFGAGSGSARLGKFSGQHRRLRVIEFETEGDATVLPWDAQKSNIDPYNRVSRAAFDWIRRIVRPYYLAAGAYDEIPTTLTRPYDRNCEHSVTEHLDNPYDYSGRERVTHKPDTDFTDARQITDRADVTAPLRLYSLNGLPRSSSRRTGKSSCVSSTKRTASSSKTPRSFRLTPFRRPKSPRI